MMSRMPSPSSRCVDLLLRASRRLAGERTIQDEVDRKTAKPASAAPRFTGRGVAIEELSLHGVACYRLTPTNPSGRHVLYAHGGSYTLEISPIHWWNLGKLVRGTGATFTVPIYPLAPHSTADQTIAAVTAIATDLAAAESHLVIAGDSAGGGMALAVAQQLVAGGITSVRRLILIAPWLDATMTDPALDAIVPKDLILRRQGLLDAGLLYAGALDPRDPRVSPIYGSMTALPPITMFCGTHDMLLADARALIAKAEAAGVPVDFHQATGGQHVYPFLPTREGKRARAELMRVLRRA